LVFDLGAAPASRVLASLVERGILVKTSEATRGPSVAYGPGPAFPRRRPNRKTEPCADDADGPPLPAQPDGQPTLRSTAGQSPPSADA
jgi:ATP-dependent DNA helicase RecG